MTDARGPTGRRTNRGYPGAALGGTERARLPFGTAALRSRSTPMIWSSVKRPRRIARLHL